MRCHYVTRFLTDDWECDEQRNLLVFDETEGKLRPYSSRNWFSVDESADHWRDIETWMSGTIESPSYRALADLARRPIDGNFVAASFDDTRALVLLFLIHTLRDGALRGGSDELRLRITELQTMRSESRDALVAMMLRGRNLGEIRVRPSSPLFMPETGVFAVPVPDDGCVTGWTAAYALPTSKTSAMLLVSRTADRQWIENRARNSDYFAVMSIGFNPRCRRWAVPHQCRSWYSSDLEAIHVISEARTYARELHGEFQYYRLGGQLLHALGLEDRPLRQVDGAPMANGK